MYKKFDILIVGAGPAGSTTALCLGNSGLKVAVLEKASFPREKICGDGLTLDVVNQLSHISEKLADSFRNFSLKLSCHGAEIYSPSLHRLILEISPEKEEKPMYICRRIDFDNFLVRQVKEYKNISIFENCVPEKIICNPDHAVIETDKGIFEGSFVVGADGVNSFVAREMGVDRISKENQCVAVRTYYKGLKPLHSGNNIEMYLFKDILPNYLWIFHQSDGTSNVGLGILASVIKKRNINLNKCFEEFLQNELLRPRFENAERIESVKGHVIPLGGERRTISGDRFILTGDAAALVDPVTGEGVANAIRSGRLAAEHIISCFRENRFSPDKNKAYENKIYRKMMPEFRLHQNLQKLLYYPWLINYIIKATARHEEIRSSFQQLLWSLDVHSFRQRIRLILKLIYTLSILLLYVNLCKGNRKKSLRTSA